MKPNSDDEHKLHRFYEHTSEGGDSPMKNMHGGRASSSGGAVMAAVESGWCWVMGAIFRYSR